jgi:apolipoprotein D and lipocalin family protein
VVLRRPVLSRVLLSRSLLSRVFLTLPLFGLLLTSVALAREPLPLVASLDPARYQGDWYEITKLPNFFQRRCLSDTRATYVLRADGQIDVINRCRTGGTPDAPEVDTATGLARPLDASRARLQVSFLPQALRWLPLGWGDYQVIALDPDYRWAMIGEPGRDYLWVLAREPRLAAEVLSPLIERARSLGFPVDKLQPTAHHDAGARR